MVITSAPPPAEIVKALTNAEALIVSTPPPPVTVARPESSALVPSVTLFVPSAVVNFSTPEMLSKSASIIVAESAVNTIESVLAPPAIVSASVRLAPTTLMVSSLAPASTERAKAPA